MKHFRSKKTAFFLIFAFLLFYFPVVSNAQIERKGNLIGFVFDKDGMTPLEGAVVVVKNISTDAISSSTRTDSSGMFRIDGLEKGLYILGVTNALGDFNAEELIGIQENKTTTVSIALDPYETRVASAIEKIYKEQKIEGEVLIGRVVSYNPITEIAQVFIIKGLLQEGDRIHVLGDETDFKQNVGFLRLEGEGVKRLFAGQTGELGMDHDVFMGDLIYLICKKGIIPFFLTPCGLAWLVAGSGAIAYGWIDITDTPETVSAFRRKK